MRIGVYVTLRLSEAISPMIYFLGSVDLQTAAKRALQFRRFGQ